MDFLPLLDAIAGWLVSSGEARLAEQLGEPRTGVHLAVCREPYIQYMLDGSKTIESRITKNRRIPFGKVQGGDLVILKKPGGPVSALFSVEKAVDLSGQEFDLGRLKRDYQERLQLQEDWWRLKRDARYATLMYIDRIVPVPALDFSIERNRQSWIIIREAGVSSDGNGACLSGCSAPSHGERGI